MLISNISVENAKTKMSRVSEGTDCDGTVSEALSVRQALLLLQV